MITLPELRDTLHQVFFGPPPTNVEKLKEWEKKKKYVVPLQGNWFVPTMDKDEKTSTWFGCAMLRSKPKLRSFTQDNLKVREVEQIFRISFVGPDAEEYAYQTMFWDDRLDVKALFEKLNATLYYNDQSVYTRMYDQEGLNTGICYVTDRLAMSFYGQDMHHKPWIPIS